MFVVRRRIFLRPLCLVLAGLLVRRWAAATAVAGIVAVVVLGAGRRSFMTLLLLVHTLAVVGSRRLTSCSATGRCRGFCPTLRFVIWLRFLRALATTATVILSRS